MKYSPNMKKMSPLKFIAPVSINYLSNKCNLPSSHFLPRWASKSATNTYANAIKSRPITETLKVNSALSWHELTNKRYFSRHLPSADQYNADLQNNENADLNILADAFSRSPDFFREGRSNLFFAFFAQWFTDGFFRSSLIDPRKTGANHHVELCQIYGLNKTTTDCLRLHENGYLRYQGERGEESPTALFKNSQNNYVIKEHFKGLSYLQPLNKKQIQDSGKPFIKNELELVIARSKNISDEKTFKALYQSLKPTLLASGLERGNATIGNLTINTFFLRCHNRICDDLITLKEFQTDDGVDDEKIFQTARAINITLLIKFTIEEYINHIAGRKLFIFDPSYAEKQSWYREPWLAAEFNLLYRWHGLIPNLFQMNNGENIDFKLSPSEQLKEHGLETLITSACEQAAGMIQAGNTPPFLRQADYNMLNLGRLWKLQPYNEYRKAFGLKPLKSIGQLTRSPRLRHQLKQVYGCIDNVEFLAGIYFEAPHQGQLVGELLSTMVAYDAFTQLYTNPLVSQKNHSQLLENPIAKKWIEGTSSLGELASKALGIKENNEINFESRVLNNKFDDFNVMHKKAVDNESLKNVLCPHLRVGIKTGQLKVDENGWVKKNNLNAFLNRSGLYNGTLLLKVLVYGGMKNSPKNKNQLINLTSFKNTFLDHGSSSGVLNNISGFEENNLKFFQKHALTINNEQRLYTEQFRKVAKEIHSSPVNFKASASGQLLQILEFKIILEVYGRKEEHLSKQKYLTYDDITSLWKHSTPPRGWKYPLNSNIGLWWTFKTFIHGYMQYRKNKVNH